MNQIVIYLLFRILICILPSITIHRTNASTPQPSTSSLGRTWKSNPRKAKSIRLNLDGGALVNSRAPPLVRWRHTWHPFFNGALGELFLRCHPANDISLIDTCRCVIVDVKTVHIAFSSKRTGCGYLGLRTKVVILYTPGSEPQHLQVKKERPS